MSNATQANITVRKLANITLEALLEVMTNCLLNLKWAATPKSTATASVWLARVLVSRNEIAFWLRETSHVWSPSPLGPHSSACIACINYDDFRRSFSEAPCGQGGGPAQVKLTGYSMTQKNTECWGLTRRKCLHVIFSTTHFIIPHFAQVYLRVWTSYRSTVKCVVKRKKSAIRSYAKLKIEICPQVVPFRKNRHILLHMPCPTCDGFR